jgi:hypothetical protein
VSGGGLAPPALVSAGRGPPRDHGAIVVVRPDQYVAAVLPLDAHEAVDAFFEPVLLEPAPAELAAVG